MHLKDESSPIFAFYSVFSPPIICSCLPVVGFFKVPLKYDINNIDKHMT